jgi:hypothetical protein
MPHGAAHAETFARDEDCPQGKAAGPLRRVPARNEAADAGP